MDDTTLLKHCSRCGKDKPATLEFFYERTGGGRTGLLTPCRQCRADKYAEDKKDPEFMAKRAATNRRRYYRDVDETRRRKNEWDRAHPRSPDKTKNFNLIRHHNITFDQYSGSVAAQGGICLVPRCGSDSSDMWGLEVDHDHGHCPGPWSCGECIRGLICRQCNVALGLLGDDITRILGVIEYLNGGNRIVSEACEWLAQRSIPFDEISPVQIFRRCGINQTIYDTMLNVIQDGTCAIKGCGRTNGNKKRMDLDHDHNHCPYKKGCLECIRGLTCGLCNKAMGVVNDDVDRLLALTEYLIMGGSKYDISVCGL